MNKVIVKINPADPHPETVIRHKNFGRFLNGYYEYHTPSGFRRLLRHDIRKLVLAIIIIILLLLLFLGEI